ncbi:MAG: S1 RNA-binding domain-containing protein [Clostridia bacterium]|nr:S1 RNA-binding domain-containing protein [Clostridia bacterium]
MAENTEVKAMNEMDTVLAKIDNESKFKKGQIVHATISQATDEGLQILLPFSKKEVALSKDEIDCEQYNADDFVDKIGDTIDLLVVELKPNLKLSQKMIRTLKEEEALSAEIEAGKEFSVVCTGTNKGGLVSQLGTYSVFVPAKEIRPGFVKDLTKYEGKTLRLRALEIRKTGRKEIIASQRVILQEERDAKEAAKLANEEEFFATIAVGDIVEGKVERATSFGAFVSVNGFDCLAHISDLSWTGAESVKDVLEIGKTYQFKVLKIDKENKKVSIGYKQLQPQPWDLVGEKYVVGEVIHGKVVRIVPFGAFVEVEKGIDGLVHVSQISYERIETPATVLNVGDEVDAKIIALDADARKMNLSIKAILPEPERKPRAPKNESGEETHKFRAPRRNDDELSNWSEGSISVGTSLADILANANKNK